MATYTLERKKSFALTAYGFSIRSNFQNMSEVQKEKAEFWGRLKADGVTISSRKLQKTIANGPSTRFTKANRGIISR